MSKSLNIQFLRELAAKKRLRKMGIQTNVKAPMTKDLLMKYTLISLFFIAFLSYLVFGLDSLLICLISVGVAIGCDLLLGMLMGSKNMMSAAVFGLIVGLSYSLGQPIMATEIIPPLAGGLEQYLYPALISAVGPIVFKRLQGLTGRKYVNPAAIAKLLILGLLFLPALSNVSVLLSSDHNISINLQNPITPDAFGGPDYYPMDTGILGSTLITCYGDPNAMLMGNMYNLGTFESPYLDVMFTMVFAKYHGWIGGFSSILVLAIGIILFLVARSYIKWRITVVYLITTAVLSLIFGFVYGGDIILRLLFHLFAGSSIFMAFFMATDPATTPLTHVGQYIFGVGLAILTMVIQVYTGFLGGSILALVIMNVTCPVLDRFGVPKARTERFSCGTLPKAKKFDSVQITQCIRCGKCLYVYTGRLPTVSIKEALEKGDMRRVKKLGAQYCQQCGTCSFVCPARIDLKGTMLIAREKVTKQ